MVTVDVLQEVMVNVGDVGEDFEHGSQLLKKLSEFRSSGTKVRAQLCRCDGGWVFCPT